MERGQAVADPDDVATWARVAGANSSTLSDLVTRADAAANQMGTWQAVLGQGIATRQRKLARINAESTRHREFDPNLIGGAAPDPTVRIESPRRTGAAAGV
jgi:hypothetical protein